MNSNFIIINDREFSITIDINKILLVCIIISYGFYGAIANIIFSTQIALTIFLTLSIIYFANNWLSEKNNLILEIIITKVELRGLLIIATFWFIVLFNKINEQITGDQLFYSIYSQSHSIYLAEKFGKNFNFSTNIEFNTILQILNLSMLFFTAIFTYLIHKIKAKKFIVISIIVFLFIILRIIAIKNGGGNSPHPPMQLVPLLISSSIFGNSDISFRAPQLLGIIIISAYIFKKAIKEINFYNALLISLATPSIPLLLHVTTLVEASIWTTLIWSVTLLTIATRKDCDQIRWAILISLISVATLMRQSVFIAIIPVIIMYIYDGINNKNFKIRHLISILSPTIIFLPLLLKSIILGTPATYQGNEADYITNHSSNIWRLYYAFNEGIAQWIILSTVETPWLFMSLGCALILRWNRRAAIQFFATLSLLLIALLIFYTIRPILWGIDRYQSEYIIPFIVTGTYLLFIKVLKCKCKKRYFVTAVIGAYLLYGIVSYVTNNIDKKYGNKFKNFSIQGEELYDYSSALLAVKDAGLAGRSLIVGSTYGVLPEIIARYSVKEILMALNSRKINNNFLKNPEIAIVDNEVTILLLLDEENYEKSLIALKSNGWIEWKLFTHFKSENKIYGLIRKN